MSELKPCPFCGTIASPRTKGELYLMVRHKKDCYITGVSKVYCDVFRRWNTRTVPKITNEMMKQFLIWKAEYELGLRNINCDVSNDCYYGTCADKLNEMLEGE